MKKGPRTYLLVESKGQVVQNILLKALLEVIKGEESSFLGGILKQGGTDTNISNVLGIKKALSRECMCVCYSSRTTRVLD